MVKTQVESQVLTRSLPKDWDKAPVHLEKISDLVMEWRLYPRSEIDHVVVGNYARALQAGANFPYVKIGLLAGRKIIVDGVHRIRSRELLKMDYVECAILQFESKAQLFGEAVRLNSHHGKGFCEAEVKATIKRLQRYKFDVDDIVTICSVPASEITLETTRPITTVTSPSGKKLDCTDSKYAKPGENGVRGLICLKQALLIVCNWSESHKIPDEAPFRELVGRAREALGKVHFHD